MNELKPCPFCGGEAEIKRVNERAGFGLYHESYCTMCASCGAQSKFAFVYSLSAKAAINSCVEAWNRRADKSAEKDKRIAELEAENVESQSENIRIHRRVRELEVENDELLEDNTRLRAERDAAVADIHEMAKCQSPCLWCKRKKGWNTCKECNFEYRGVREGAEK